MPTKKKAAPKAGATTKPVKQDGKTTQPNRTGGGGGKGEEK